MTTPSSWAWRAGVWRAVLAAAVAVTAIAGFSAAATALAEPTPTPAPPSVEPIPMPLPAPSESGCAPGQPQTPACFLPTTPPSSSTAPAPPPAPNPTSAPEPATEASESSWIAEFLTGWIRDFFADVARSALNGVLGMLADSLLATPQFDQIPVMGQLWDSSRNIMIAAYALVTTIAGVVAVSYQTLQTRSSVKEILPRLVIGFVAANLSLFLGGKAIEFANALSQAFLGDQTGAEEASHVFVDTLLGKAPGEGDDFSPYGDLYVVFTILALVVMIIAVLLTYVVRIALTVVLLASAPLVLMCHALPQTESIAFWWWRVFGAILVVQVAQSLTFIAALKIFYLPGGITIF